MSEPRALPNEFTKAYPVMERIEQAGYEAYFVGGSVRDLLLHQAIHDVDIATSAFPAEVKGLFSRTIDVGIEHGTVLVLFEDEQYEITTFRTESTYQDFRRPEKVEFVRSLAEDLKRRDFTINALALTPNGEFVDLFEGIADLNARLIRAVGNPHERFHEDALRMMRGLRFVSQLDFQMEARTLQAISENSPLLAKISVERIAVEFEKLMLGKNRIQALHLFVKTKAFVYCPELATKELALMRLINLPNLAIQDALAVWGLVVYVLGLEKHAITSFLKAWKCSNQTIKQAQAIAAGLTIRQTRMYTVHELYQFGEETLRYIEQLVPFFDIVSQEEKVCTDYRALAIHSMKDVAINGRDLMTQFHKESGPWLKEWLQAAEHGIIAGEVLNEKQSLFDYLLTRYKE